MKSESPDYQHMCHAHFIITSLHLQV